MFETYKGHRLIISELPVELEPNIAWIPQFVLNIGTWMVLLMLR